METVKGEEVEVMVRTAKRYPATVVDEETGEKAVEWRKLKPFNQRHYIDINLEGSKTAPISIRKCKGNYSVVWPDSTRPKTVKFKGKEYVDRHTDEVVVVKGDREQFPTLKLLTAYLAKRFGKELSEQVCGLLKGE